MIAPRQRADPVAEAVGERGVVGRERVGVAAARESAWGLVDRHIVM